MQLRLMIYLFQNPSSPLVHHGQNSQVTAPIVVTLKSRRKMSEMIENKLSMLISEPMEAELDMGYPTNKQAKSASVSLDAGPLQRV